MNIDLKSFKPSWQSVAPLTCGLAAIAAPAEAASVAISESLLEFAFDQDFISTETDTDANTIVISTGDQVTAEALGDAVTFSNGANVSGCGFDLGSPGVCNVAFSEATGDDGSDYFAEGNSFSNVLSNFFVPAGNTFAFNFVSALFLETEVERPEIEQAEATAEASFSVLGGSSPEELAPLDSFTLAGSLSAASTDDSLMHPQETPAFNFDEADFTTSFGGDNEFVEAFASGSYEQFFENDTYVQLVEVKDSAACVSAGSSRNCKQSVPEPTSMLALLAPVLGATRFSMKKRAQTIA